MELKIRKVGNNAGLVLPLAIMKALGTNIGDSFDLEMTTEGLHLKVKPKEIKYTIELLAAQCDMAAPEPEGLNAWKTLARVGRELS
jgi:antitoxin ChpS